MGTRTRAASYLGGLLTAVLMVTGVQFVTAPSAFADCGDMGQPACPRQDTSTDKSSGTVRDTYAGSGQVCSVYANGTGMGSYCVTIGSGNLKSLREQFGNMVFQQCRYREIPEGMPQPFNPNPDKGRYMLQLCLQNINFDTYNGGRNRLLKVDVVWVPYDQDVKDNNNGLNQFLWNSIEDQQQLPVPFLYPRPSQVPIVGVPAFLTFRWLDPGDRSIVAEGPYAGKAGGGPYKRITTQSGLIMEARAVSIRVDPRQKGIPATDCAPSTPYIEGARPNQQPANACSIVFPRSSASARELSTVPIPPQDKDTFYGMVTVKWQIRYGTPGDMRQLGNGFTMNITQRIPVQEIQGTNQPPPAIIY